MTNELKSEINTIIEEGWTDGLAVSWGTHDTACSSYAGTISNSNNPVSHNTLYDLASVTKIFFLVSVVKFIDEKIIDLDAQIGDYSSRFKNISSLKLYELMNFSASLYTDERISIAQSKEYALNLVHNIKVSNTPSSYSDMGAITLYTLLNDMLDENLHSKIIEIFQTAGLKNTLWWTDYNKCNDIHMQSYSRECYLSNDHFEFSDLPLGTVHDPKARILGSSGHAGLFSTPYDITLLCQAILSNTLISKDLLQTISSFHYDYSTSSQHYGLLCYKKALIEHNSEVPFSLSDSAFAISGYTGTYIVIDPELDFFASICSNRIYNKYPNALPSGIKCPVFCTNNYVYRKDKLLKTLC